MTRIEFVRARARNRRALREYRRERRIAKAGDFYDTFMRESQRLGEKMAHALNNAMSRAQWRERQKARHHL